ncbi:MAG TPA: hypothetical protein PLD84_14735 [Chitinophagales bacterium]|nr:hypothetical protein [Chitinophagales bacterium]
MNKSLEYVLEKFPEHRFRIIDLYNVDEDFRMLCEDYLTSAEAIGEYRLHAIKDKGMENEFSQVYVELEKEIIHLLGNEEKSNS